MKQYDLTILTADRFANHTDKTEEGKIADSEHELIQDALEKLGFKVAIKSWADRQFDWSKTDFALFRTTWDYFERFDEFIRWIGRCSRMTRFINPVKLIQWNLDKHYLIDLKGKGIPVVPTVFLRPLTRTTLLDELKQAGWEKDAVLKPSISASARHTYHLKTNNIANHESVFQRLLKSESLMIQPFIENIVKKGEISLVMIDGKYSHAVLKRPRSGDFRVQSDHGGSSEDYHPDAIAIEIAERTVEACIMKPLYARVDLVWNDDDELLLSEVELIEPELFLRYNENSAAMLADAIHNYVKTFDPQ